MVIWAAAADVTTNTLSLDEVASFCTIVVVFNPNSDTNDDVNDGNNGKNNFALVDDIK